jgi:hypothetical protein
MVGTKHIKNHDTKHSQNCRRLLLALLIFYGLFVAFFLIPHFSGLKFEISCSQFVFSGFLSKLTISARLVLRKHTLFFFFCSKAFLKKINFFLYFIDIKNNFLKILF